MLPRRANINEDRGASCLMIIFPMVIYWCTPEYGWWNLFL